MSNKSLHDGDNLLSNTSEDLKQNPNNLTQYLNCLNIVAELFKDLQVLSNSKSTDILLKLQTTIDRLIKLFDHNDRENLGISDLDEIFVKLKSDICDVNKPCELQWRMLPIFTDYLKRVDRNTEKFVESLGGRLPRPEPGWDSIVSAGMISEGLCGFLVDSELNFYQTAHSCLQKYWNLPEFLPPVLRYDFQMLSVQDALHNYIDICLITQRPQDVVYEFRIKNTNDHYILKYIQPYKDKRLAEELRTALDYKASAKIGVHVLNFYQTFKVSPLKGDFLQFELCICEFMYLIESFSRVIDPKMTFHAMWSGERNILTRNCQLLGDKCGFNVMELLMVYSLEIFGLLDYLSRQAVVHGQLRSENLMIAGNRHLKLKDFGIEWESATRHRDTELIEVRLRSKSWLDDVTSICDDDDSLELCRVYDLEMCYNVVASRLGRRQVDATPCFLVDAWSAGLMVAELLSCGVSLLDPEAVPTELRPEFPILTANGPDHRLQSYCNHVVRVCCSRHIHDRWLGTGLTALLTAAGNSRNQAEPNLARLLLSLLRPRCSRAEGFLTPLYRQNCSTTMHYHNQPCLGPATNCLDLVTIAGLPEFRLWGLSADNVFLRHIPVDLEKTLLPSVTYNETFSDLGQLVDYWTHHSDLIEDAVD